MSVGLNIRETPTKPRIFRVGFRPSTQPTRRKFIKPLKIKGYDFYLTRVIEGGYSVFRLEL
ncbi:hypothetical protein GXM_03062 [Nostoc sphaeroides CCNUC1]|uniref:Uncharacterized protein n=1 Tax=Nostoc sphaeroides CCNUC1 TaxID=2653204 RepID=A0A5P8VYT3_9NOSO|nr:hypothetical protein GXM_03062 [Nostoc sphaeroides CCNUC1]